MYLGECMLRVLAMGRATYLMSRWNRYDLFVTIYGFVMLCLGSLTYRLFFLTLLLHLSRALRIFRVRTPLRDDPPQKASAHRDGKRCVPFTRIAQYFLYMIVWSAGDPHLVAAAAAGADVLPVAAVAAEHRHVPAAHPLHLRGHRHAPLLQGRQSQSSYEHYMPCSILYIDRPISPACCLDCVVVQVPLTGDFITENANFSSFPLAFLTLIRMVTGENWNGLMHEVDSYSTRSTTYFCSFIILMSYVMLNLFIATMLENFQVPSFILPIPHIPSTVFHALTRLLYDT